MSNEDSCRDRDEKLFHLRGQIQDPIPNEPNWHNKLRPLTQRAKHIGNSIKKIALWDLNTFSASGILNNATRYT